MRKDKLWKGIIEDLAEDLLRFFFPEYEHLIDWDKAIEFLDKELSQLFPESESSLRHADKLFKVWLKGGEEHWFMVHVEVQGYPDPNFSRRMYQSFYRIDDRYGRPVTALVIYTDSNRKFHFSEYRAEFWGTKLTYQFNTFILLDHPVEKLKEIDNIFALVMESAWQDLMRFKDRDQDLFLMKVALIRKLIAGGYSRQKTRRVIEFIQHYVSFEKSKISNIFGGQLNLITKERSLMGIEETILEELRREGREGEWDPKLIEEFVDACFEAREQGREIVWDLSWSESIFELMEKAKELGQKKGEEEGRRKGRR